MDKMTNPYVEEKPQSCQECKFMAFKTTNGIYSMYCEKNNVNLTMSWFERPFYLHPHGCDIVN